MNIYFAKNFLIYSILISDFPTFYSHPTYTFVTYTSQQGPTKYICPWSITSKSSNEEKIDFFLLFHWFWQNALVPKLVIIFSILYCHYTAPSPGPMVTACPSVITIACGYLCMSLWCEVSYRGQREPSGHSMSWYVDIWCTTL